MCKGNEVSSFHNRSEQLFQSDWIPHRDFLSAPYSQQLWVMIRENTVYDCLLMTAECHQWQPLWEQCRQNKVQEEGECQSHKPGLLWKTLWMVYYYFHVFSFFPYPDFKCLMIVVFMWICRRLFFTAIPSQEFYSASPNDWDTWKNFQQN